MKRGWRLLLVAVAMLLSAATALAQQRLPRNPTGECDPHEAAIVFGYFESAFYRTQDCQNPRKRVYWEVVISRSGGAALIPMVDLALLDPSACTTPDPDLNAFFGRWANCGTQSASERYIPNRAFDLETAFKVSRYLHSRLRFTQSPTSSRGVLPYPYPADIAAICSPDDDEEMKKLCHAYGPRSSAEDVHYEGPAKSTLVDRLNRLYGTR
jgi:hypothetical protein